MKVSRTLRFRLAAWYCLALSLGLGVIGVLLFALARHHMLRHYDGPLQARADKAIHILQAQAANRDLSPDQMEAINQIGRLVIVQGRGEGRQVIYFWPEMTTEDLAYHLRRMDLDHRAEAGFETLERQGVRWRLHTVPFHIEGGRDGWVVIVEDLRDVQAMIRRLLLDYLVLAILGLLVSFYGSYWLSGQALQPMVEIIGAAKAIEASNLHQRLPNPGLEGEVGTLVETLNRMFARLEASFEAMKRFTADASHELRSPLATIRNTIDVALEQPRTPEECQATIASIGEEVDRIRAIVDDLLLFARADSGKLSMALVPMRLGTIVEAQVEAHQFQAEERGITLTLGDLAQDPIAGDERWVHQVVCNLLDNALKFTPEQGQVSVEMRSSGTSVEVLVHDTGPGIPAEDLERIFDRFFRSDPSRSRSNVPGLGLGLAIASWVVKEHGGSLRAANRPQGGSTFTVTFPKLPPPS